MKLYLLLALALATNAYGAAVEKANDPVLQDVADEGVEYRLKQDLGKAFEKAGQWLQGNYTPETEDERKKLEMLNSELEALIANAAKEDILDGLDDEAAAYGWGEVITGAAKTLVTQVVINKIASIIVGAMG
uniref:Salivary gland secreted protein n=1 Tax=Ixodes ricinus TaxID=34613 RepID=Q2XPT3_IXORI|nr:salivary gland secreted protein [Ixodes ricinus]